MLHLPGTIKRMT